MRRAMITFMISVVPAGDTSRLENLCHDVLRPPIAQGALELLSDGNVLLRLRRP